MGKIILKCVKVGSKLRIRFHSFVNEQGEQFMNVYDNSYNCQFPRSIRREGCYYEIPESDIALVYGGSRASFYTIKTNRITVLNDRPTNTTSDGLALTKTYAVSECVICMEEKPDVAYIPCGHACSCSTCYQGMRAAANNSYRPPVCPLCRTKITNTLPYTANIEPPTPDSVFPTAAQPPRMTADIAESAATLDFATEPTTNSTDAPTEDNITNIPQASAPVVETKQKKTKKPTKASKKPDLNSINEEVPPPGQGSSNDAANPTPVVPKTKKRDRAPASSTSTSVGRGSSSSATPAAETESTGTRRSQRVKRN